MASGHEATVEHESIGMTASTEARVTVASQRIQLSYYGVKSGRVRATTTKESSNYSGEKKRTRDDHRGRTWRKSDKVCRFNQSKLAVDIRERALTSLPTHKLRHTLSNKQQQDDIVAVME